jgi:uncharacterized membrane protein
MIAVQRLGLFVAPFTAVLLLLLLLLPRDTSGQKLHDYESYQQDHQNILVIGETGSGKSTFVQFMLVNDLSKVDHKLIAASTKSVTDRTIVHRADTFVFGYNRISATYYDTVGFNARDIDSTVVYRQLEKTIEPLADIHKIIIVHKVGRAREDMIAETERTIELLEALGATTPNAYVTLTFAYDYNEEVLVNITKQVADLYKKHVLSKNIFCSYYVLISEITKTAQQHYIDKIQSTHLGILHRVLEPVKPFHPVVASLRRRDDQLTALMAIVQLFLVITITGVLNHVYGSRSSRGLIAHARELGFFFLLSCFVSFCGVSVLFLIDARLRPWVSRAWD